MDAERIEGAVRRIEAALARIGEAADAVRPTPPSVSNLVVKHEALREAAANTLKEIDDLIERLES
jgi:hypothetical protein